MVKNDFGQGQESSGREREQTLISLKCNWDKTRKEYGLTIIFNKPSSENQEEKPKKVMDVKHVGDALEQQVIFIDT